MYIQTLAPHKTWFPSDQAPILRFVFIAVDDLMTLFFYLAFGQIGCLSQIDKYNCSLWAFASEPKCALPLFNIVTNPKPKNANNEKAKLLPTHSNFRTYNHNKNTENTFWMSGIFSCCGLVGEPPLLPHQNPRLLKSHQQLTDRNSTDAVSSTSTGRSRRPSRTAFRAPCRLAPGGWGTRLERIRKSNNNRKKDWISVFKSHTRQPFFGSNLVGQMISIIIQKRNGKEKM